MTWCGDWVRAVGGEECLHIGAGSDNEWESMSVEAPPVGLVDCAVNDPLGLSVEVYQSCIEAGCVCACLFPPG